MKKEILKLVQVYPKHYVMMIRKNHSLLDWVNSNTLVSEDSSLPSKIYSAIHQISNVCDNGKIKNFDRWSTGFVNCGPAKKCLCTANAISNSVKETKSKYTPEIIDAINDKRQKTMLNKYGVGYNSQREDIKSIWTKPKISEEALNKLSNKEWLHNEYVIKQRSSVDIASELNVYYSTVASYCVGHGFTIRRRSNYSLVELEIGQYLTELGITYETSNWSILGNKELDIYIPSHSIAIEVNGLYWHSYNPKQKLIEDQTRHVAKTNSAKEKNIDVIHVTDWEWKNKQEIIKSILANKLGKTTVSIGARKCSLQRLTHDEAKNFFISNHLQGHVNSEIYLGLIYQNNIVMAISVGHSRFDKNNAYELHRMASKIGISVPGGASKLISHLKNNFNINTLITYCDRSKSNGDTYSRLGFTLTKLSGPGYFWTDGTEIISRYKAMRKNLKKWLPSFNPVLSEAENMFNAGYRRYWDCGNIIFIME